MSRALLKRTRAHHAGTLAERMAPMWPGHLPWCDDECPLHDGKRCEATGHHAPTLCEPAVEAMAAILDPEPIPDP